MILHQAVVKHVICTCESVEMGVQYAERVCV